MIAKGLWMQNEVCCKAGLDAKGQTHGYTIARSLFEVAKGSISKTYSMYK